MNKFKRKSKISARACVLFAIGFLVLMVTIYEFIIFCALDKLTDDPKVISAGSHIRSHELKQHDIAESDKVLHELLGYVEHSVEDDSHNKIINTVHFVWCPNDTFSFQNYISILSVWKTLRPDIIEFHQKSPPKEDKYDDWLLQLQKTIPSLVLKELPANWDGDDKGCGFWFGLAVIDDRGGIFVDENVIVTDVMVKHLKEKQTIFFSKHSTEKEPKVAVAMGIEHNSDFKSFRRKFASDKILPENANMCVPVSKIVENVSISECYVMDNAFHPYDVLEADDIFGELVRDIMYGSKEKKVPQSVLPGYIPKIVHYVWFGQKEMDFMMYLSMLSTLFILNPEKVIIHTDGGLSGKYLTKVRRDKRVLMIKREKPFDIFGHRVLYAQHRSDIVRAECLLKYGGIYMDWDVLWLKDPDDLIKTGYDAIANFDHMQEGNFPNTINLGVFMAKPKSTFVKRWQDALINYRSEDFLYNAVQLPYKIYERYPQYLKIQKNLQVMCFRLKCHPVFHPNFKSFTEEQPFDWRKDVYSIHFTFPDPDELTNETALHNGSGRFADIGRFILQHENKLG
ncbi:hypothetical protein ACF0H5_023732 [Mactra antiquata]